MNFMLVPQSLSLTHLNLVFTYFVLQCRDGFAGDGEECEQDPDLDAIPVKGLSCTLHDCRKVRHSF